MNDAEIIFFNLTVFKLLIQNAQAFCVLCRNNDSARVSVDSVDKGGRKGVFILRVVFALFIKITLHSRNKSVIVFVFIGVRKQTDFFVEQENVFILINDIKIF